MAIAIPALVDAQLLALKNSILPHTDSVTKTSAVGDLFVRGNRLADVLRLLTGLVDSGTLTVTGIHGAADATNPVSSPTATDQATADTMANEMKADYNAHRVLVAGSVHGGADATNVVTAADGDGTEGKLVTLSNDIRTQLLAHMAKISANTHYVVDPNVVTVAACTDLATAIVLMNHLKAIYNAHIANISGVTTGAVVDSGAFTGANKLIGCKATFAGNVTAALAGATAYVMSNTTSQLNFRAASLPAIPRTGDTFTLEFAAIDAELEVIDGGKGLGNSQSNPYGYGPTAISAIHKLVEMLGGTVPTWLLATPFTIGSPHAGGSAGGHGGAQSLAAAIQLARDTVAAYTKPA